MTAEVISIRRARSTSADTAPGSAPGPTAYELACDQMRAFEESAAGAAAFERDRLRRAQRLLTAALVLLAVAGALGAAWLS